MNPPTTKTVTKTSTRVSALVGVGFAALATAAAAGLILYRAYEHTFVETPAPIFQLNPDLILGSQTSLDYNQIIARDVNINQLKPPNNQNFAAAEDSRGVVHYVYLADDYSLKYGRVTPNQAPQTESILSENLHPLRLTTDFAAGLPVDLDLAVDLKINQSDQPYVLARINDDYYLFRREDNQSWPAFVFHKQAVDSIFDFEFSDTATIIVAYSPGQTKELVYYLTPIDDLQFASLDAATPRNITTTKKFPLTEIFPKSKNADITTLNLKIAANQTELLAYSVKDADAGKNFYSTGLGYFDPNHQLQNLEDFLVYQNQASNLIFPSIAEVNSTNQLYWLSGARDGGTYQTNFQVFKPRALDLLQGQNTDLVDLTNSFIAPDLGFPADLTISEKNIFLATKDVSQPSNPKIKAVYTLEQPYPNYNDQLNERPFEFSDLLGHSSGYCQIFSLSTGAPVVAYLNNQGQIKLWFSDLVYNSGLILNKLDLTALNQVKAGNTVQANEGQVRLTPQTKVQINSGVKIVTPTGDLAEGPAGLPTIEPANIQPK